MNEKTGEQFPSASLSSCPPGSLTDAASAETPTCTELEENGGMEVRLGGYVY